MRAAAERAREIARRLGRRDLELIALDSVSAGLNIRGLYGHAMPIDHERLDLARTLRDRFEVGDSFYTAAWSSLVVGLYPEVVALVREFEAMGVDLLPIGPLALAVLAQVPFGDWDAALADHARALGLLGEDGERPPSMASGGWGAAAFIHEARGDRASADRALAVIDTWSAAGEHPRNWALPLASAALVRRGEFAAARRNLARLSDNDLFLDRELETRCALIAAEGSWHEADAVIAAARRHAANGRLRALPLTRAADVFERLRVAHELARARALLAALRPAAGG